MLPDAKSTYKCHFFGIISIKFAQKIIKNSTDNRLKLDITANKPKIVRESLHKEAQTESGRNSLLQERAQQWLANTKWPLQKTRRQVTL